MEVEGMPESPDEELERSEAAGNTCELLEKLHGEWLEIIAAVLLALATVATAWSAYQAARWSSHEALKFNQATAKRVHAAEAGDLADQELGIDTEMFVNYVEALRAEDWATVEYYDEVLFRQEMRVAVNAWLATDPENNPEAPETPFAMEAYENENLERSRALEVEAQELTEDAKEAIGHSDFYILLTVLLASVLFFAGICTKFKGRGMRLFTLIMALIFFTFSAIILAFQPVI